MSYQELESYLNPDISEQFQKIHFHLINSEDLPESDPIIGIYLPKSVSNKIKEVVETWFEILQTNKLNLQLQKELI